MSSEGNGQRFRGGLPVEEVLFIERACLVEALIEELRRGRCVSEVPVRRITTAAGSSRWTFYEAFPGGRSEWVLMTFHQTIDDLFGAVVRACVNAGGGLAGTQAVAEHLTDWVLSNPGLASLVLIDVFSLGQQGVEAVIEADSRFVELLERAASSGSDGRAEIHGGEFILGGARHLLRSLVTDSHEGGLSEFTSSFTDWLTRFVGDRA